jgi:3-oxoadipate enol-lactonase
LSKKPSSNNIATVAHVTGTRLYYERAGAGHPVVFLHGFALASQIWDSQFAWFASSCKVLRYDMRGFGKSDPPSGASYSHVEDLRALLDELGIERATLLGFSMGGAIAINFALTYPERTCGLILEDTTVEGFELSPATSELWSSIAASAREVSVHAAKLRCLDDPLFWRTRKRTRVARRLREILFQYSGWHWLNNDPQRQHHPPATAALSTIA